MYRLIVESLLGLRRTQFHIEVSRAAAGEVASLSLDGMARSDGLIPLADDGHTHRVALRLEA
jgi:hypothetical protein